VVNGTAIVTRDDEEILLRENESIFVPLGCMHRLENPGKVPLNLIEIQSGAFWARMTSSACRTSITESEFQFAAGLLTLPREWIGQGRNHPPPPSNAQ